MQLLGARSSGDEGAVLLVILVGIIVLPAVIYFCAHLCRTAASGSVGIICALAIGNAAQQPVVQSEAAQPGADARNDTVAVLVTPASSEGASSGADLSAGVSAPSAVLSKEQNVLL